MYLKTMKVTKRDSKRKPKMNRNPTKLRSIATKSLMISLIYSPSNSSNSTNQYNSKKAVLLIVKASNNRRRSKYSQFRSKGNHCK